MTRQVVLCDGTPTAHPIMPKGPKKLFAYSEETLAQLLGMTEEEVRYKIKHLELDPTSLKSIAQFYQRVQYRLLTINESKRQVAEVQEHVKLLAAASLHKVTPRTKVL